MCINIHNVFISEGKWSDLDNRGAKENVIPLFSQKIVT